MSSKPRLLSESTLLILSTGAERLSGLVVAALIGRILGPQAFGEYSLVLTMWNIFGVVGFFGQAQLVSREVARFPERAGSILGTSAVMTLAASAVAGAAAVGASILFGYSQTVIVGVLIMVATILWADSQCRSVEAFLIGSRRVFPIAVINIGTSAARAAISLALVTQGISANLMLIVIGLTQMATAASLWVVARRELPERSLRFDMSLARGNFRSATLFSGAGLANMISTRAGLLLLDGMLGSAALGVFSAGYRVVLIAQGIVPPVLRVLLPRFAHALTISRRAVLDQIEHASEVLGLVFGSATIGLAVASPVILVAIFGRSFEAAITPFLLLTCSSMPLAITGLYITAANATDLEHRTLKINVINALFGFALGYACIALFGINGAAASLVISSVLWMLQAAWILRDVGVLAARSTYRILAPILLLPALASAATWVARDVAAPVWAYLLVFLVCEIGLLWSLRARIRDLAGRMGAWLDLARTPKP